MLISPEGDSKEADFDAGSTEVGESGDWLAQQLAEARAELSALEQAVDELPQIFEAKFRQGLAAVVQTNRQLAAQQVQLRRACAEALPPARSVARWVLPPWCIAVVPRQVMVGVAVGAVVLLAIGWGATVLMEHKPSRSRGPAPRSAQSIPVSDSQLILRASGTSWVEVQDLVSHETLLIGNLDAGEQRTVRMRRGLRIRSGRPDLLRVAIDGGPPAALGDIHGLGWRTVMPPRVGA